MSVGRCFVPQSFHFSRMLIRHSIHFGLVLDAVVGALVSNPTVLANRLIAGQRPTMNPLAMVVALYAASRAPATALHRRQKAGEAK